MQAQSKERWQALCEQAAHEKDPVRLMQLVDEINRLLAAKEEGQKPHSGSQNAA